VIIVTGGAGFVGSNLVHELNRIGERNILLVDNLTSASKFPNLAGAQYADYMDKREFRIALKAGDFEGIRMRAILHQGACTNTLDDDDRYMMDNNFTYSKELLHFALEHRIPFIYASTAAVYGESTNFNEIAANERPLNVYGYSKLVFDNYVRHLMPQMKSTVIGLRYFNVYGPRERHKGRMASVVHNFTRQLKGTGKISVFEGSGGYGNGEQCRDFIFVKDIVRINIFFAGLQQEASMKPVHAVVNAGTGEAHTFKTVAELLIQLHGPGEIEYIPFPDDLRNRYQHYTQAEVAGLRASGYTAPFTPLEEGIVQTFTEEPVI
jgi:ADP-L-glycero-D-manno-heptose 6-epimerase